MEKVERKKFSKDEREDILIRTDGRCAHCGCKLTVDTMTVEHMIPISKGGTHDKYNTIALCQDCNFDKSNQIKELYYFEHIAKDYVTDYMDCYYRLRARLINNTTDTNSIMLEDEKAYLTVPHCIINMLRKIDKKHVKRKRKLLMNSVVQLRLEKAYEGDAEEIINLINRNTANDNGITTPGLYTVSYELVNIIRYGGLIYVLRQGDRIVGAFIFERVQDKYELPNQIVNISETTGLNIMYINTLNVLTDLADNIYEGVLSEIFSSQFEFRKIPLYFNVLSKSDTHINSIMSFPHTINGVEGNLQTFTIKGMMEHTHDNMISSLDKDNKEHMKLLDEYVEATIYKDTLSDERVIELQEMMLNAMKETYLKRRKG